MVTLTINGWDMTSGVTFMKFSNDGMTWSGPEPYSATKDWMLGSKNGIKTVYVMFQDAASNWSSVFSASILLEAGPTIVSIVSPSDGYTQNKTPVLNFTVNKGDTINTVRVDDVVVNKVSGDMLDTLGEGSHIVWVEAVDANGLMGFGAVIFTVDSVVPVVTISAPAAGTTYTHKPVLSYSVTEGTVEVTVDGNVVNTASGSALDPLGNGTYTVRVEATDAAGNIGAAEVVITVASLAPTVVMTSPVSGITKNKTPLLLYTVSDGTVIVKVDGAVVNKVSGNLLAPLKDGSHTVRVEATSASNVTDVAEVTFTVDATAPVVTITSPASGQLTTKTPILIYTVSHGAVVVKLDDSQIYKASGNTLNWLASGSHTVRVEATDSADNFGFAEVTFSVPEDADDTNPACNGATAYLVGPSSFTNGITMPDPGGNAVVISSPTSGQEINGPRMIIKGAMDTALPVEGVTAQVADLSGTYTYPAQVNGKYFAAVVPVSGGNTTITVTAMDQNSAPHQAIVTVRGVVQSGNVTLQAGPSTGIPMPNQSGQNSLDVILSTTTSLANPVTSYIWDFTGAGTNQLSCIGNANITASYQQPGLYLTQVTVSDNAAHSYKDVAIVNVLDANVVDNQFTAIWTGMKTKLRNQDIAGSKAYFAVSSRDAYQQHFTRLKQYLPQIVADMGEFRLVKVADELVEYDLRTVRNGDIYSFQVLLMKDQDGVWRIKSF